MCFLILDSSIHINWEIKELENCGFFSFVWEGKYLGSSKFKLIPVSCFTDLNLFKMEEW